MLNLELEGKVAVVTGASRGLGRAGAIALLEQGVKVLGVARSREALEQLEKDWPGAVQTIQCDMQDADAVASIPQQAIKAFGRLDIVINNAGIAPAGAFVEQRPAVWEQVMAVNVMAPMLLSQAAGAIMLSRGTGKIINIASTSGLLGKPTLVAYSSSKGALIQFTKALAGEWAKHGVQVNAIAPGAFETDAQSAVLESKDLMVRRLRKIPSGRMGNSEEIGPLICYLASCKSDFVTGAVYVIDGGESSKL